jgi:hypothetical protein
MPVRIMSPISTESPQRATRTSIAARVTEFSIVMAEVLTLNQNYGHGDAS